MNDNLFMYSWPEKGLFQLHICTMLHEEGSGWEGGGGSGIHYSLKI